MYIRKNTFLFMAVAGFFAAMSLFAMPQAMLAQDTASDTTDSVSEEVALDQVVSADDLGVEEPTLLPDSPFYFLKNWGRGISLALTFDAQKDAAKRLQHANERLIEAQKLAEEKGGDEAAKALAKAADRYEHDVKKVKERVVAFEEKAKDNPEIDKFLDKLADNEIKHQKILEKLEGQVSEQVFVKIKEARERSLEHFGEVMAKLEDKDKIKDRLERVFKSQKGSDLKHLKDLEFLKELEDRIPEEIREEIKAAEEQAFDRVREVAKEDHEKFGKYLKEARGDMTRRLEILSELDRANGDLPEALIEEFDHVRDFVAKRFEDEFERHKDDSKSRDKFLERLKEGKPEILRLHEELRSRISDAAFEEELKKADLQSVERFKKRFSDDPEAIEKADLFKKFRENPDLADFELLEKLEGSLTGEQKEFIDKLRGETSEGFRKKFEQEGDRFLKRFVDPNPRSLEVLNRLREELPESARRGIDQAREVHLKRLEKHAGEINDPEVLFRFRQEIERGDVADELRKRGSGLIKQLEKRHLKFQEDEAERLEKRLEDRREEAKDRLEDRREEAKDRLEDRREEAQANHQKGKDAIIEIKKERRGVVHDRVEEKRDTVRDNVRDKLEGGLRSAPVNAREIFEHKPEVLPLLDSQPVPDGVSPNEEKSTVTE